MPTPAVWSTWLPSRRAVQAVLVLAAACAVALVAGADAATVSKAAAGALLAGAVWMAWDAYRTLAAWRAAPITLSRRLPHALAIGVTREVMLELRNPGARAWQLRVFDHVDTRFEVEGWPQSLRLDASSAAQLRSTITARQRGKAWIAPAELRLHSLGGSLELIRRVGPEQSLPVYPNFAALARYAWLSGDRRLDEIGIKPATRRGEGTDFKQLNEYQLGDEVRHIDWKASQRRGRPVVREFQDDRDQRVLFLLDCGRRMRADDSTTAPTHNAAPGGHHRNPHGGSQHGSPHSSQLGSHFDQALDALMLLAYVALKSGDEVGAMTFGGGPEQQRRFAPRKGMAALDALVGCLHDVQPGLDHADHLDAARRIMLTQQKRALIVILTNFKSEDAPELKPALQLLRTRHLVLLASLRERALGELQEQALTDGDAAISTAGAHLFEQQRRDAFIRLAARDALLIDVEPQHLAPALVNRYREVKRSGRL